MFNAPGFSVPQFQRLKLNYDAPFPSFGFSCNLRRYSKGFSLKQLQVLCLDEADRLLNLDFEQEIDQILKVVPRDRRTQLFSATMTSKVAKLQRACLRNPVKVEVSAKYSTVDSLKQQYLFIPAKHKDCYINYLFNELSSSSMMVFTRTCDQTRKLAMVARNLGFGAIPIHGQMSQPKRLGALNKFKAGERNILVATDVASRGLDIPSVDVGRAESTAPLPRHPPPLHFSCRAQCLILCQRRHPPHCKPRKLSLLNNVP